MFYLWGVTVYLHNAVYIDDEDFEADGNDSSLVIAGNETRKCVNVPIIDDKTVEMRESFGVVITFPPEQQAIDSGEIVPSAMQINGTINIIDDDGEYVGNEVIIGIHRNSFTP